jgi:hypothetical protein
MQQVKSLSSSSVASIRAQPRRPRCNVRLTVSSSSNHSSSSSSSTCHQQPGPSRRTALFTGLALAGAALAGGAQPAPSAAAGLDSEYLTALDGLALMPDDRKWIEQLKAAAAREARAAECAALPRMAAGPGQFVPVGGAPAGDSFEPSSEPAGASVLSLFDGVPLTPEDQEWLPILKAAEARRAGSRL